jgi:hypothetical protein
MKSMPLQRCRGIDFIRLVVERILQRGTAKFSEQSFAARAGQRRVVADERRQQRERARLIGGAG